MVKKNHQHTAYDVRKTILELSYHAGVGHVGCALSIADIIFVLYEKILRISSPKDPKRDYFILSKGHAVLALYATFFLKRWMTKQQLYSYCTNATMVAVHPQVAIAGVELSTGSLGQGIGVAVGIALGCKMSGSSQKTFVLISDGECDEGSTWEAALAAAHHKLDNLTVILDNNGQQGFGYTNDVLTLAPLKQKWSSFGFNVIEVDGHNIMALTKALLYTKKEKPTIVIAKTVLGKGVSFMEQKVDWHYLPLNQEHYQLAMEDIKNTV